MASESFLAVPTVSNMEENATEYAVNINHMTLLESVKALGRDFGDEEEVNLEMFRQITDTISAPPAVNNQSVINNGHNGIEAASSSSTNAKKGKSGRGRNSKTGTQQPATPQSDPRVSMSQSHKENFYSTVQHMPSQQMDLSENNTGVVFLVLPQMHVSADNTQFNQHLRLGIPASESQPLLVRNVPSNSVTPFQGNHLLSPVPSYHSISGSQMAEMMYPSKSADDSIKNAAKPNYLNQCKNRLRKYQTEAMRDLADLIYAPFATKEVSKAW